MPHLQITKSYLRSSDWSLASRKVPKVESRRGRFSEVPLKCLLDFAPIPRVFQKLGHAVKAFGCFGVDF
jgi:hypothetical protein